MLQNLMQYMIYQSTSWCKSESVYSDLLLELVLFQFDTVLAVVVYRAVQKLEIKLSNFYLCQCQM